MVEGLVIGGVFGGSKKEIFAAYEMAKVFYPDLWDKVLADTPNGYRDDPIVYHLDKSLNGSRAEQKKSTYVLDYLESGLCRLDDRGELEDYDKYDPSGMQIELMYVANNCFLPEDYILENVAKITVPTYIVQGRFDMVCLPDFAYKISKIIPDSKLYLAVSNHGGEHEVTSLFRAIIASLN
jgi:proline iminopeptidase